MPMVGHRDHDGIYILLLEGLAQVFVSGRLLPRDFIYGGNTFGQGARIDVADAGNPAIRLLGEVLRQCFPTRVDAYDGCVYPFVRPDYVGIAPGTETG